MRLRPWGRKEARPLAPDAHVKYRAFAATGVTHALVELVTSRWSCGARAVDPLDELVENAPPRILEWIRRKTRLADAFTLLATTWPELRTDARTIMSAGLLLQLAGVTLETAATMMGVRDSSVSRYHRVHRELMTAEGSSYAELAERVAREVLKRTLPSMRCA